MIRKQFILYWKSRGARKSPLLIKKSFCNFDDSVFPWSLFEVAIGNGSCIIYGLLFAHSMFRREAHDMSIGQEKGLGFVILSYHGVKLFFFFF